MGRITRGGYFDDYFYIARQQSALRLAYTSRYEERQLRQDLNSNHRQVLSEMKRLGESKLSVTVVASEIAPAAEKAEAILSDQAKDYDLARARWDSRIARVRAWQAGRKERKKKAEAEAEVVAYIAANMEAARMADALAYVGAHSGWLRKFPLEDALALLDAGMIPSPAVDKLMAYKPARDLWASLYEIEGSQYDMWPDWRCRSCPSKPALYGHLAAIREVAAAARLTPSAMLTIPSPTVQAIAALCHD